MTTTDFDKFWIEEYPDLGTEPVPTEPCISPEYYRLEQERLFCKVWLKVGQLEDIPNPGDFFVREIEVCHASVIIVRGDDGAVRAFHNGCPIAATSSLGQFEPGIDQGIPVPVSWLELRQRWPHHRRAG